LKALETTNVDEQWKVIEKSFQVDEVIAYFAVSLCLSNWDGFFNNYFTYHDVKGSGKWEIYPWDEDKTWGFYDGLAEGAVFFDMPLDYGQDGAVPPGSPPPEPGRPTQRGRFQGFVGDAMWWRPPGISQALSWRTRKSARSTSSASRACFRPLALRSPCSP
jgi:spore coat protein CotH